MDLTKIFDYEGSKQFFDYSNGNKMQGYVHENSFFYDDVELTIVYFLGNSKDDCYDFKKFNKFYNTKKDYVAIGVLGGDDTFGYYKNGKEIYLHLDTEANVDGEVFVCVAKNLEEFIKNVFDL